MKKRFAALLSVLFWLTVWEVASLFTGNTLLLPGPVDTFHALMRLCATAVFWQSIGMTLLRVLLGYVLAVLVGTGMALLCTFLSPMETLFGPLCTGIRCTPVASFIVLLWLWLSKDAVPAFVSALMVVPVIWTGVQEGLKAVDPLLLEMSRAYRFPFLKKLRDLYFPSLRSHFSAACLTGLGFAWKSGISAEVIAVPLRAIGTGIHDAKVLLETDTLFAWTAAVILLSVLLEKGLHLITEKGKKHA